MSRRGPVEEPGALSARELAAEIGVSRDTLHSWIDRGLLTPVPFRGAATRYGASHQLRAKIIAKLRALEAEIARELGELEAML